MKYLTFVISGIILLFCFPGMEALSQGKGKLYTTAGIRNAYEKHTRSRDGYPGPKYWQNSASYNIHARFVPESVKIFGRETIDYQNNSPDTLKSIMFQLKQNIYKKGTTRDFPVSEQNLTDGVTVNHIIIGTDTLQPVNSPRIQSFATLMYVTLDSAQFISPGSNRKVELEWSLSLPQKFELRTGKSNDSAFFIGYWFPQIAVYDDVTGWDNEIHTGIQETYNDISSFDVKLEVPGDYLVWATGDLQNPESIYTQDFHLKVEESKQTDEIIRLISEEDLIKGHLLLGKESHLWHFKAAEVTDFAFAVSNNSVWDATSVITDSTSQSRTWVSMVYQPKIPLYPSLIKTAQNAIHFFSHEMPAVAFPFQKHTTFYIQGTFGGMEFPMMAANGVIPDSLVMIEITAHEIAHSYFPFFICTNEEKYAWMDEGWVTLLTNLHSKYFNLPESSMVQYFRQGWNTEHDLPLGISSGCVNLFNLTFNYYEKPRVAAEVLFEIFEEKGISNPLKLFMERWVHKHPSPYDFFYTMEDLLKEDLSWYWKPWYFEFSYPDLKIEKVISNKKNVQIQVSNPGGLPLPVALKIEYENGEIIEDYKSAYVWKGNPGVISFNYKPDGKIAKVSLGDCKIDVNKADNVWKPVDYIADSKP